MLTGRILRFDEVRGYGFIAPDRGGEDVFLHANALTEDKDAYRSGVPVEFEALESDRGLKATSVRILRTQPSPAGEPVQVQRHPAEHAAGADEVDDEPDGLCDVLSSLALGREIVELALESVPSMTGEQIGQLRRAMLRLGQRHGWVED